MDSISCMIQIESYNSQFRTQVFNNNKAIKRTMTIDYDGYLIVEISHDEYPVSFDKKIRMLKIFKNF